MSRKYLYLSSFLIIAISCTQQAQNPQIENRIMINEPISEINDSIGLSDTNISNSVGDSIIGDFDGDGRSETATLQIDKEGKFEESAWTLAVHFSNKSIPPIIFECDREYSTLINEGKLGKGGEDKISIYSPPLGGCTFNMTTYMFDGKKWQIVVQPFLVSTACDEMSEEDLQKIVFDENGAIYYYQTDSETMKLIRIKAE